MESTKTTNKKFIIIGFSAGLLLLILYFSILSLAESFSHAIQQFSRMWYWILILVVGFGLQVGLYFYIRESIRLKQMTSPTGIVAVSGGVSTGAMVACCLHHVTDVLPLIGLAAAAVFLTQYQVWFLILGILSNLVGITILLELIQKNNLAGNLLKRALVFDMGRIKKATIGVSLVLLAGSFFLMNSGDQAPPTVTVNLPSKTDVQAGISFKVKPLNFNLENPVKFEIAIDTHSGSLDFDIAEISFLEDDKGNKYQPINWEGPGPGGHHISGTLVFPEIDNQTKTIKLTIQDTYPRIFEWEL